LKNKRNEKIRMSTSTERIIKNEISERAKRGIKKSAKKQERGHKRVD
jgi:hypothetical protein